jgi:hypothetical protein
VKNREAKIRKGKLLLATFLKEKESCFNFFYLMMQIGQGSINFKHKSGVPGVGKVFCHQPFCKIPRSTSRFLRNSIII